MFIQKVKKMLDQQSKEKIIKMKEKSMLTWLSEWFESNCDGDWEHDYGIKIETLDNPGWSITIDLEQTKFKVKEIDWNFFEKNDNDWFGYKVINGKFEASGDPFKLEFLIKRFKQIIEENQIESV